MNKKERKGKVKSFCIAAVLIVASLFSTAVLADDFGVDRSDVSGEPIWEFDGDLTVHHVEVADLNSDGTDDVIAAEYDSTYYDNPSDVFALDGVTGAVLWTYTLQSGVRSFTIGDINGDGVMDAVAGASMGSTTPDGSVHAINGVNGNALWVFTPGGTGDTIGDVAVGDFDGDSYMDVAVACWDDNVYGVKGSDGSTLWVHGVSSIFVNGVDTGDVDGDGVDDVAYAHSYLSGYSNYMGVLNGADGSSLWTVTVPETGESVLLEDIDSDGFLEAIFGVQDASDNAQVVVRDGATGTLEWTYTIGYASLSPDVFFFTHDVDDDGDVDLVVGNEYVDYYVRVFNGDSNTPMWTSEELDGYARDIVFGDVDDDGYEDMICATFDRVQSVSAADGLKQWSYGVNGNIYGVGAADFDGDGVVDIAAGGIADSSGSPPNPSTSVWAIRTVQSRVLWEHDFGSYGNELAIGDLDSDGFEDVIIVSSDDIAVAIDGEDGTEMWTYSDTDNLYAVTTGDFNGDGDYDVAVGGASDKVTGIDGDTGSVIWTFTSPGNQIYRKCLKSTDLDLDGFDDVVVGCDDGNVYGVDGSSGITLWVYPLGGPAGDVKLEQMDNTGGLDVVVAVGSGSSGEKVVVLDGSDASLIWEYDTGNAVEHVATLDYNNDGIMDVAAGCTPYNPKQVVLIDGATQSSVWTVSIDIASSGSHGMDAGDVDGDGVDEVIVPGSSSDNTVYALDGSDGSQDWTFVTGDEVTGIVVADVSTEPGLEVVVGSEDQSVYILDGTNGNEIWSYSTVGAIKDVGVGDINNDNTLNIAAVTFDSDGIAYAFNSMGVELTPPVTPVIPSGPTVLAGGEVGTFSTSTTDPDGEDVQYRFNWDDGTMSSWTVLVPSGTAASMDHAWTQAGIYQVRAQARDVNGSLSGWSDPLEVNITSSVNNPPNVPSNPNPQNGALDIDVNALLHWTGGDPDGDAVTYDVYFESGDSSPDVLVSANQSATSYDPGTMDFVTTYYWQIVAWDDQGAMTEGPVWSFTTSSVPNNAPEAPSDPDPSDGAIDQLLSLQLSWACSDPDTGDTLTYDVYLEADDTNPDVLVADDISVTSLLVEDLSAGTVYYWKIVAMDNHGASTSGPVWSFTTFTPVADLSCSGSLSWTDISGGATVYGEFSVENTGDAGSLLDWEIVESPDWGTFTFNPSSGTGLTPEDGTVVVNVTLVAPEALSCPRWKPTSDEYSGEIFIENSEDPTDNCTIQVSISVPVPSFPIWEWFISWIAQFIQQFPLLEQVFSHLL